VTNQLTISPIKELFEEARAARMDYVYSLLRVEYYSIKIIDPLLRLKAELDESSNEQNQEIAALRYISLIKQETPLDLLANLFSCVRMNLAGRRKKMITVFEAISGTVRDPFSTIWTIAVILNWPSQNERI
jgi:hypothetical protein